MDIDKGNLIYFFLHLFIDFNSTKSFLLNECQRHAVYGGGFSKTPDSPPDILHTFYSICWLSLLSGKLCAKDTVTKDNHDNDNESNDSNRKSFSSLSHIDPRYALLSEKCPP